MKFVKHYHINKKMLDKAFVFLKQNELSIIGYGLKTEGFNIVKRL